MTVSANFSCKIHFNSNFSTFKWTIEYSSSILNPDKNTDSHEFLIRANKTCEWMWSLLWKSMIIFGVCIVMTAVASIFIVYLIHGEFDEVKFYRLIRLEWVKILRPYFEWKNHKIYENFIFFLDSLPWNQLTIWGYFGEISYYEISCAGYIFVIGVLLLLFISICIHHHAFYQIFEHSINEANRTKQFDKKYFYHLARCHIAEKE